MQSNTNRRLIFPKSPLIPPLTNQVYQQILNNTQNSGSLPCTDIATAISHEGLIYFDTLFKKLPELYAQFGTQKEDLHSLCYGFNAPLALLVAKDELQTVPLDFFTDHLINANNLPNTLSYRKYLTTCFDFLDTFSEDSLDEVISIFYYCSHENLFLPNDEYYIAGVDAAAVNFIICTKYFQIF